MKNSSLLSAVDPAEAARELLRRRGVNVDEMDDEPEKPLWTPYPLPNPQSLAVNCKADVIGFGGQAGGGKTDLLLGLGTTQHLRSIIFRREAKQGRSMIDRSHELLAGVARFNSTTSVWRDIPGGRQIEFAGVKDAKDVYNWRGQPHDFIGIDEADAFSEAQVRFLMGWLRTTIIGQHCRAVFTFNPPATAEGRWLIDYFAPWLDKKCKSRAVPGELRWYAMLKGEKKEIERPNGQPFEANGELVTPTSRTFFPADVRHNPALMATDYITRLQSMPEPLRSQLLYGDMDAGMKDDPWQAIPTEWIEAAMERWTETPPLGCEELSALGADVARGGSDQTLLSKRKRNWFAPLEKHPGKSTPDGNAVVGLIIESLMRELPNPKDLPKLKQIPVNIDVLSCGTSPHDLGRDMGLKMVPINFAAGTHQMDRANLFHFKNMRAYAYWSLRDALDPKNGDNLMLPPDRELLADLTAPHWKPTAQGIQLESKEDIKKRIGRSPDCADAVVYAHLPAQTGVLGCA